MKLKPVLSYILFFVSAVLVFSFLLFPQKKAADYVADLLTNSKPDLQVTIDRVKLGTPFTLHFQNLKFAIDQTQEIIPDSFEVSAGPSLLFSRKKSIKFRSQISKGEVKGILDMESFEPFILSQAKVSISGIKINGFPYKTSLADITMGGDLNGEYTYSKENDRKHFGQGKILIRNLSAKMEASLFNALKLPVVDFSDIAVEFTQRPESIVITKCIARGAIINVRLKGSVDIASSFENSLLHFTGVVLPDSPKLAIFSNLATMKTMVRNIAKDGIGFKINGSLKNPKIEI